MPKETTNARRGNIRTSPSKARGPMHCNKCTGRPLRTECIHTEAGRAMIKLRAESAEKPKKGVRSSPRCNSCDGRPLRSQCVHTRLGRIYLQEAQILAELSTATSTTAVDGPPDTSGDPGDSPLEFPGDQSAGSNADSILPIPDPLSPQPSDCYVPMLSSSPQGDGIAEMPSSLPVPPQADDLPTSLTSSEIKSDYSRATKANPKHGFVRAMRGAARHDIVRKHARQQGIYDAKVASKRFLENMNRLIERCDDLAATTGCWLFIGAQHCSGVGATLHYTSPRLIRDAGEQMNDVANDFHVLMTNLLQARRTEALELTMKLLKVETAKEEALKQANGLRERLTNQERLLELYATRLGIGADELEARSE